MVQKIILAFCLLAMLTLPNLDKSSLVGAYPSESMTNNGKSEDLVHAIFKRSPWGRTIRRGSGMRCSRNGESCIIRPCCTGACYNYNRRCGPYLV
ncbi:unnamed protein product [Orchesella dallaii]|uniref:Conotoxin n=1 Tax=Orchesella dallaii TaxID=48710 RepID=A0ABP1REB1_9HEXA